MEMSSSNYVCKPKHGIDTIDLKIIRFLSRDCRASYRDISSIVGVTPNAIQAPFDIYYYFVRIR
jgi:hypothetical protein